jgi:hypothetical protein
VLSENCCVKFVALTGMMATGDVWPRAKLITGWLVGGGGGGQDSGCAWYVNSSFCLSRRRTMCLQCCCITAVCIVRLTENCRAGKGGRPDRYA